MNRYFNRLGPEVGSAKRTTGNEHADHHLASKTMRVQIPAEHFLMKANSRSPGVGDKIATNPTKDKLF